VQTEALVRFRQCGIRTPIIRECTGVHTSSWVQHILSASKLVLVLILAGAATGRSKRSQS
jgi:hypothetical protein